MKNILGQVSMLRWPKPFKEKKDDDDDDEENDNKDNIKKEDNNNDKLACLTLKERVAYQSWSNTVIKIEKLRKEVASSLFHNLPHLRTTKSRYTFDPSIMTDDVSVSLQFSKTIHITPTLNKGAYIHGY